MRKKKIKTVTLEVFNKVIQEEKNFLERQRKIFRRDYKQRKIKKKKYKRIMQHIKNDLLEVELIERRVINGVGCRRSTGYPSNL